MSSPVRKLHAREEAVHQQIGIVTAADDQGFLVSVEDRARRARRAVGCLVWPEAADRVLLAEAGPELWILSVLERPSGAALLVRPDGDLGFRLVRGRFTVAAQEGIDLVTAREASVVAGAIGVTAGEGRMRIDALSWLGRAVHAEVERVKLVAGLVDSAMERWSQRAKRVFRVIGLDHLRAEQLDYQAEQTARIHAHDAIVTADQFAKIDAEQIHVG
jgi:hypothetical protein